MRTSGRVWSIAPALCPTGDGALGGVLAAAAQRLGVGGCRVGVVDPRGGSDAWFKAVFGGQTRGRGRSDMEQAPDTETLPRGAEAGVPCPRCGGAMRVLPGPPLPTKVPTLFIGCSSCGFVGLRAAGGPEGPKP